MKVTFNLTAIVSIALLASTTIQAQTNAPGAPSNSSAALRLTAPTDTKGSAVSFSPSVATGVRTDLTGRFSDPANDEASNSVGPYVTPGFELGYKKDRFTLGFEYTVEISGAKGFGKANEAKDFQNNLYYQHEPVIKLSGGVTENWTFNLVWDTILQQMNSANKENNMDLVFIPEIERKISPAFSLSAGYFYERLTNFDAVIGPDSTKSAAATSSDDPKSLSSQLTSLAAAGTLGAEPTTNIHSGIVRAKINLTEETKINTYLRSGKMVSNQEGKTGYLYRWNTDLTSQLTKEIDLALRYRLQIQDFDTAAVAYLNRGRIIANYALNDNWSLNLQNTLDYKTTSTAGSHAKYENENYLGATFKF